MRCSERLAVLITVAAVCVAAGYLMANRVPPDSYRIRTQYGEDILFAREDAAEVFNPLTGASASPSAPRGLININAATSTELQDLPGIGPALAKRIIDYRTEHGAFTSIDELLNVSGIGEKVLAALKDLISV